MKKFLSVSLLSILAAAAAWSGPLHTKVLPGDGTTTFTIDLREQRILQILNFVNEGGSPGTVELTKENGPTVIMTSEDSAGPEMKKTFYIAGPATVKVTAGTGITTISFRQNENVSD
jgi:hypothetical protein